MNTNQTNTNAVILLIGTVIILVWGYFIFNDLHTNGWPLEILIIMIIDIAIALITEALVATMEDDRIGSFQKRPIPQYGIKANILRFFALSLSVTIGIVTLSILESIKGTDYRIMFISATSGFSQTLIYFLFFMYYAQRIDTAVVIQAEEQRQEERLERQHAELVEARKRATLSEKKQVEYGPEINKKQGEYDPERDIGSC